MSIGKKLLSLRQEKGISQEALGRELNVSRQTVSKWESDLSLPDMKMMITISQFYEISITHPSYLYHRYFVFFRLYQSVDISPIMLT